MKSSFKKYISILLTLIVVIGTYEASISASTLDIGNSITINNEKLNFNNIYFVDAENGDDVNGDGSRAAPLKSIESIKALDEGDALVLRGTFNSTSIPYGKGITVIGEGRNTVVILNKLVGVHLNVHFYGIIFKTTSDSDYIYYSLISQEGSSKNVIFSANNCVFWDDHKKNGQAIIMFDGNSSSEIKLQLLEFNNCLAIGNNLYRIELASSAVRNAAKNRNSATNMSTFAYRNGTMNTTNSLIEVDIDKESFDINSEGWENTGVGLNPNGETAHIGVYGGPFAWGYDLFDNTVEEPEQPQLTNELDMVLEVEEKLLLSVDTHLSENINMIWTSSDESVATVDNKGMVTAVAPGETTITATAKNGKYTEVINILVVDEADDYRLAADLKVGESCRATIDKNQHKANVIWSVRDESVATVSSKGKITAQGAGLTLVTATNELGKVVGEVYIRVR